MVTGECTVLVAEYTLGAWRGAYCGDMCHVNYSKLLMTSFSISMPVCPPSLIFKSDEFPAAETST